MEFVTVAAEFCGFLERVSEQKRSQFVDTALKLLPLLYLKASLLPECERMEDFDPETFVTESDYEQLRREVAALMGDRDDYLEVFLDDMMYSDTPIHRRTVRAGRHLPVGEGLYLRVPSGTGANHERFPGDLPGTVCRVLGTASGQSDAGLA